MTGRVEEEYADVLQNIETAIVAVYADNASLSDRDVLAAINALLRTYAKDGRGHSANALGLSTRARRVYDQCRGMCEWRLGRRPLNEDEPRHNDPRPGELSVSEVVMCLRRIRKSVKLWHAEGGRQGYLRYVRQFLDDAASSTGIQHADSG